MKRELKRAFLRMDVLSSQHNFLTVRTTLALGLMLDHDYPLRRQLDHLAAFPLQGCDLTHVILTHWTGLYPMTDHAIRGLHQPQHLSRMTWLASCFLPTLFVQTPGLPLEAIRRWRQMTRMTVFRQTRLQVFHLGCEQGGLLTLPLDQLLLAAYLLPASASALDAIRVLLPLS